MSNYFYHFQIQNNVDLSIEDQKTLSLLYQPLIGPQSLGTYYVLLALKPNIEYRNQFLLDLCGITQNIFIEIREKLEALRLLETYHNEKTKQKLYFLIPPYKSQDFLKDPLLGNFLLSEVGENNFLHLQNHFTPIKINLDGFKDVSKKFDDIYQFQKINFQDPYLKEINTHKDDIAQKGFLKNAFDYQIFLQNLPERFKKPSLVEWGTIDFIQKLSLVYDLTPQKIAEFYQKTFNNPNDIDLSKLRLNIKKYHQKNYSHEKIVSSTKIENNDETTITFLNDINSTQRIIKNYCQKNTQAAASDTVFQFIQRNDCELGIVNALLIYILRYREGILPSVVYLEKILKSWLQKGINDTETAYDFLIENKTQTQSNFQKSQKKPKWLDEAKKKWQS